MMIMVVFFVINMIIIKEFIILLTVCVNMMNMISVVDVILLVKMIIFSSVSIILISTFTISLDSSKLGTNIWIVMIMMMLVMVLFQMFHLMTMAMIKTMPSVTMTMSCDT